MGGQSSTRARGFTVSGYGRRVTVRACAAAVAVVAFGGCQTTAPGRVALPRPVEDAGWTAPFDAGAGPAVPVPCAAPVEGTFVHARDPRFFYLAIDDGGAVLLRRFQAPPDAGTRRRFFALDAGPDAGVVGMVDEPVDAGPAPAPVDTELVRTDAGLVGWTRGAVGSPWGQSCTLAFEVRVADCSDAGLTLRAERLAVGKHCERLDGGGWIEHPLVRSPTAL